MEQQKQQKQQKQQEMLAKREKIVNLNRLGIQRHKVKDNEAAMFYYNEALNLLTNIEDEHQSHIQQSLSSYTNDNRIIPTSLSGAIPLDPRPEAATPNWVVIDAMIIMQNVALLQFESGNIKHAEKLLKVALKLFDSHHDVQDKIFKNPLAVTATMAIYTTLGKVRSKEKVNGLPNAIAYFMKALQIGKENLGNHHGLVACVYVTMGQVLAEEAFYDEAMGVFHQASRIYNRAKATSLELKDEKNCAAAA